MAEAKDNRVLTPEARTSFVTLIEPKPFQPGDKEYYSLIMIFPAGSDLSALVASAKGAMQDKWPDPVTRPEGLQTPFRKGTEKSEVNGFPPDSVFITAKTKLLPGMVDRNNKVITDPSVFYSGCWVRAVISPFAYETGKNRGVSFWLSTLQFVRDDTRLGGGGGDPTKDFEALEPLPGSQPDNLDDPFA